MVNEQQAHRKGLASSAGHRAGQASKRRRGLAWLEPIPTRAPASAVHQGVGPAHLSGLGAVPYAVVLI